MNLLCVINQKKCSTTSIMNDHEAVESKNQELNCVWGEGRLKSLLGMVLAHCENNTGAF